MSEVIVRQIYLDHASTTPLAASVREAMLPFLAEQFGDPSATHALGRAAQEALDDGRGQVANLLGADPDEIVFTSGGTESNNLAIQGVLLSEAAAAGGHVVVSACEHSSVLEAARFLERLGYDVTIVGCNGQGVVQPAAIAEAIHDDTRLVSVQHANHEVGTLQPLRKIAEICHEREVPLHTDACLTAGRLRTLVDELDVDLLSLAGHKMHGPKGAGALYIRRGVQLEPILHGSGQEAWLRPGTENVAAIVGLGRAAWLASQALDQTTERLTLLADRLWQALLEGVGNGLVLHGALAERVPGLLSVSFPGVNGREHLARVPEVCAMTGSACQSPTEAMSPTLAAMGVPPEVARGTVRLSIGRDTSEEDVDRGASLLVGAWEALRYL